MTLQQEIIQALGAKPHINPEEEIRRSVDFLKAYLKTYPFFEIAGVRHQRRAGFDAGRETQPDGYRRIAGRDR
ncbi:NAD synthetase [Salmonella enterica subsp. enterica]|uniref:NAD synthetase n=1 Tax=Salmonella enterica I TaxID=59201 RepID=A0A447PH33_SALET|nr:NAD synthetase [Salmonella enterica subsp. enterica]